jgi:uracil-DNA glycosylase family 4
MPIKLGEACEICPYRDRPGPIASDGDDQMAEMILVGEAPGEEEIATGKGFSGPAGRELWKLASAAGFYRPQVKVMNVVKCLPIGAESGDYKLDPLAIQQCKGYLKEEILKCRTKVVVPLGNVAAAILAGKWGIIKERGTVVKRFVKG